MLETTGTGTDIRWQARFKPAIPGTGRLIQRRLERSIADAAAGLAHAAAEEVRAAA